jgi:PKD repeat protein
MSTVINVKNIMPEAIISYELDTAFVGETLNFSGKSSRDSTSDKPTLIYQWDFNDGVTDTGMNVAHAFLAPGEYDILLSVSDDDGGTHSTSISVLIKERPKEAESISSLFDTGSTEGLLMIVAIIMIAVLMIMMVMLLMIRSSKRKKAAMRKGRVKKARMKRKRASKREPLNFYDTPSPNMMAYPQFSNGQFQNGQYPYDQQALVGQGMVAPPMSAQQPMLPNQTGYPNNVGTVLPGQELGSVPEGEVFYDSSPMPALPPADEPEIYNAEPAELPPEEPPVVEEAAVPATEPTQAESTPASDAGNKFCGNCGAPTKSSWFICPECKNML